MTFVLGLESGFKFESPDLDRPPGSYLPGSYFAARVSYCSPYIIIKRRLNAVIRGNLTDWQFANAWQEAACWSTQNGRINDIMGIHELAAAECGLPDRRQGIDDRDRSAPKSRY